MMSVQHGTNSGGTTKDAMIHIIGAMTSIVGLLPIYFLSDDKNIKQHAAVALDWHLIYASIVFVSAFASALVSIAVLVPMVVVPLNLAFGGYGAYKAKEGKTWNYPFAPEVFGSR